MAETDYLTLEYDDGKEIECEIMGTFPVDGKEYIALLPLDQAGKSQEEIGVPYIYGYEKINDEDYDLRDIEDEDEFNKVVAEFDEIMKD